LAGGAGSRLGFSGPKGLFPILGKPLFQHHLEKIPLSMPVAVMTSPQNSEATKAYFEKNAFFGREVRFFEQTTLPLLDEKYRPVGFGADGNGSVYASLLHSGILDEFERRGVQSVFFLPVENPLADPTDGRLLALNVDVAIQCVSRIKGESMGALAEDLTIVEYFNIAEDDYSYSYVGQVALSMPFLRKASSLSLPLHWVRKKAFIGGQEMWIWKREKLLFDAFPAAETRAALCCERELCYAPIKGAEQKDAVEKLLRNKNS
jgi:UDP-N-acetylglucosamine pyrophosphorylase